jgi:hypothetical protein
MLSSETTFSLDEANVSWRLARRGTTNGVECRSSISVCQRDHSGLEALQQSEMLFRPRSKTETARYQGT